VKSRALVVPVKLSKRDVATILVIEGLSIYFMLVALGTLAQI
jgi:hypothetical protein